MTSHSYMEADPLAYLKNYATAERLIARLIVKSDAPTIEPVTTLGWYKCTDGTQARCSVGRFGPIVHTRITGEPNAREEYEEYIGIMERCRGD